MLAAVRDVAPVAEASAVVESGVIVDARCVRCRPSLAGADRY